MRFGKVFPASAAPCLVSLFFAALGVSVSGCQAKPQANPAPPPPSSPSAEEEEQKESPPQEEPGEEGEPGEPGEPNERREPSEPSAQPSPRQGPSDCQVLLRVELQERDANVSVRVLARNLTPEPLTFELPERCPNGLIDLVGLGPGYDYYQTCNKGACQGFPPARRVKLSPGQEQILTGAHVSLQGKAPCTKPLSGTRFEIGAVAPTSTVSFCTESAVLELPKPLSAEERKKAGRDPYFCETSAECVLSCPSAPGCCGDPCGCRHAINKAHQAAHEEGFKTSCQKPPCPAYGCAYEPAYFAVCHQNRCVGADSAAY